MLWTWVKNNGLTDLKQWLLDNADLHHNICCMLAETDRVCERLIEIIVSDMETDDVYTQMSRATWVIRLVCDDKMQSGLCACLLLHLIAWWERQPEEEDIPEHDLYDATGLELEAHSRTEQFRERLLHLVDYLQNDSVSRMVKIYLKEKP